MIKMAKNGRKTIQLPIETYERIMRLKDEEFIYEFIDRCIEDHLRFNGEKPKGHYCRLKDRFMDIVDLPCMKDPMLRCQFQPCFQKVLGILEEKKRGN